MNYYQEITIIPDAEIPIYDIWTRLYTQLHIALADVHNKHGINTIGVSFPNYKFVQKRGDTFATLGYKLRIFAASEHELNLLNIDKWLNRLTDYVHIKSPQPVPEKHGYVVVRRYRYKDPVKQAEEYAQFKGISLEEAITHCQKHKRPIKQYPFVVLKSETHQRHYRLGIVQEIAESPKSGVFTSYGINTGLGEVTVPHW